MIVKFINLSMLFILFSLADISSACTVISVKSNNHYFVGRNFDWYPSHTAIVKHPMGQKHQPSSQVKSKIPVTWVTHYPNVTFNLLDHDKPNPYITLDGLNNQGLSAAQLWLGRTEYPKKPMNRVISTGVWVQYILDQAKNVKKAIQLMRKVTIEPDTYAGKEVKIHLIVHDRSGHSAVFEYLKGQLKIFKFSNKTNAFLTNTDYASAISNLKNYQFFGGKLPEPQGPDSYPRFVRAAIYLKNLPKITSTEQGAELTFAGLNNAKEVSNTETPTLWSVVYDLKNLNVYFKSIDNQKTCFFNLTDSLNSKNMTYHQACFLIANQYNIKKPSINIK